MTTFIELSNSTTGATSKASAAFANGSTYITLSATSNFPSAGTVVFIDSLSNLQELTYTANSADRLTGVTAWTGSGTLLDEASVHETSYDVSGNTNFTEVSIS